MTQLELKLNDIDLILETGRLAKQASGAVRISYGDTVVLATAVASSEPRENCSFLPLMCDYQEMYYASGHIPGNYFRREVGRPGEKETLTSRLIDRPLRPRFPDGFNHEIQIIASAKSIDPEIDADVIAITGASAALCISDIPFDGPIAGVRVGRTEKGFVVNPTRTQLAESDLNIVIAGSSDAIVMVEGMASVLPEQDILDAIMFGHEAMQPLIEMQNRLVEAEGVEKMSFSPPETDPELVKKVTELAAARLQEVIKIPGKMERNKAKRQVREMVTEELASSFDEVPPEVSGIIKELEKKMMRDMIVNQGIRIDGRRFDEVRPITCKTGELPRAHGSAVFTRGETQALAVATLGSSDDEQRIESPFGQVFKNFILHYNFPPFCVGEARMLRGPARREIGHGALAERALSAVVPPPEDFLYTIRVVSEVLESNGSSSMATVCGGCLAMMDAGIPLRDMVSGIAMGLIKDEESGKVVILSDILGDEDHLGDMDFKVAGTPEGISALQMDIKISGIDREILEKALMQAKEARAFILEEMKKTISTPRSSMSQYAPRVRTIRIKPEKIKDIIGPGGKVIKAITAETGVKMDVDDSGEVNIFSSSAEASDRAIEWIRDITKEAEIGAVYDGKVKKIMDFGAFVEILPGTDGLLHISQIDKRRVEKVTDVLKEGDKVKVKVLDIDRQGKIRLSRKVLLD